MFVHFPVALWTASVGWDALGVALGDASWWTTSYWCLAAGLAMALPAVLTGFAEFLRIRKGDPAEKIALWHMGAMSGAAVLFLASLLLHRPATPPQWPASDPPKRVPTAPAKTPTGRSHPTGPANTRWSTPPRSH